MKDASGNVLDLKNLRPDGTIGEPVDESEQETVEETGDVAERTTGDEPTAAARL